MPLKQRLLTLAAVVTAMTSGLVGSQAAGGQAIAAYAKAESSASSRSNSQETDPGTATMVNYGTSFNYGSIGSWKEDDALPSTEETFPLCREYNLFRNVVSHGEGLFGRAPYLLISADQVIKDMADQVHFDYVNANLYAYPTVAAQICVSYDMQLFTALTAISSTIQTRLVVPALCLGEEIVAAFKVSATGIELLTPNEIVISVSQSYSVRSVVQYYTSGGEPVTTTHYFTDILFTFKTGSVTHVSEIGTVGYGSFKTEQSSEYTYEYGEGYVEDGFCMRIPALQKPYVFSLPYEITYFDYHKGHFGLGHSAYGERYGTARNHKALHSITMTVYSHGVTEAVTFKAMDEPTYIDWSTNSAAQLSEESHPVWEDTFAYLSRGILDNEVGGEGSLVRACYIPRKSHPVTQSSAIKVLSMSFYDKNDMLSFEPYGLDESQVETYQLPLDSVVFKCYVDVATALCTFEFKGVNISNQKVVSSHSAIPDWLRWVLAISTGGLSFIGECFAIEVPALVAELIVNGKYNIQRFYFNMYDMDNHVIPNVFKMDFAYQQGRKEVNQETDGFITSNAKPWPDLGDPEYAKVEVVETNKGYFSYDLYDVEFESDGFVSIEDEPQELAGVDYHYYYQNVYETEKYSDFMCWWSPLSIWYKTSAAGETIRASAQDDGTYAVEDENGEKVIMSVFEPGVVQDITFDEWLAQVADHTNGTNHGIEPGEPSDTGKIGETISNIVDSATDWWNGVANEWKVSMGIALGVAAAALVVFILFRFFGGGRTVVHVSGGDGSKYRRRRRK